MNQNTKKNRVNDVHALPCYTNNLHGQQDFHIGLFNNSSRPRGNSVGNIESTFMEQKIVNQPPPPNTNNIGTATKTHQHSIMCQF